MDHREALVLGQRRSRPSRDSSSQLCRWSGNLRRSHKHQSCEAAAMKKVRKLRTFHNRPPAWQFASLDDKPCVIGPLGWGIAGRRRGTAHVLAESWYGRARRVACAKSVCLTRGARLKGPVQAPPSRYLPDSPSDYLPQRANRGPLGQGSTFPTAEAVRTDPTMSRHHRRQKGGT